MLVLVLLRILLLLLLLILLRRCYTFATNSLSSPLRYKLDPATTSDTAHGMHLFVGCESGKILRVPASVPRVGVPVEGAER